LQINGFCDTKVSIALLETSALFKPTVSSSASSQILIFWLLNNLLQRGKLLPEILNLWFMNGHNTNCIVSSLAKVLNFSAWESNKLKKIWNSRLLLISCSKTKSRKNCKLLRFCNGIILEIIISTVSYNGFFASFRKKN
jgi:hypothetical protein